jgi:pimeloyl-ACP methyl ester carboxylesterase
MKNGKLLIFLFFINSLANASDQEKYFDQSFKDQRNIFTRSLDFVQAYLHEIPTSLLRQAHNFSEYPDDRPTHVEFPKGLIVMVHGLTSTPSQWWRYYEGLKESLPDWSFYIPKVKNSGDCYLDEAVKDIEKNIFSWAQKINNRSRPIIIMGTSNGGRIALELMNKFREQNPSDERRILVISIAGAIGGSKLLEIGTKLGVARLIKSEAICTELRPGSNRIKRLLADTKENLSKTNTDCLFISIPTEVEYLIGTSLYSAPDFHETRGDIRHILLEATAHSGVVLTSYPIIKRAINEWVYEGSIRHADLRQEKYSRTWFVMGAILSGLLYSYWE